ncbi:MAG: amylo-alpha-1,6-glucosidase [Rikenellaceae bacterium]
MLATNRAGGYMSTTIVCCNTRKYHGLMVTSVEELDSEDFVLLSSLDETIVQHNQEFNLAIHRYLNTYSPRGHKYIVDFAYTPTPTITYRVGDITLRKELLWIHTSNQLLIRYTLVESSSPIGLKLRPFLAFRGRHELSRENMTADTKSYPVENGASCRLYEKFPWLNMQINKTSGKYVAAPYWHNNFEYLEERRRGFECLEDLLTPGYFEMTLKKGESVVFSASTTKCSSRQFKKLFDAEIERRSLKTEFIPILEHSARQFLINYNGQNMLTTGYHWYNPRSRETFVSLAGCTLTQGLEDQFREVLDYHVARLHDGLFGTHLAADTQLWFFYTLQRYNQVISKPEIWNRYSHAMKAILETYRMGCTPEGCIQMHENGLIHAAKAGVPLTWMNVVIDGQPLTPRTGYAVDVNALWYNAVCYTLDLARANGDQTFVQQWQDMPELIAKSFNETFWSSERGYLADSVYEGFHNFDVRPNQLLAASLEYSPLSFADQGAVVNTVRGHLLTTRGLRTLSPRNPAYKGSYHGDHTSRDIQLHQGTVYPWLLEHYVAANFRLRGQSFIMEAEDLLNGFQEDLLSYGIGSVSGLYDGDPPHRPAGAISYAPSVAAVLTINQLIKRYKK